MQLSQANIGDGDEQALITPAAFRAAGRSLRGAACLFLHIFCLCGLMLIGGEAEIVEESEYEDEETVEITATTGLSIDLAAGSPPNQERQWAISQESEHRATARPRMVSRLYAASQCFVDSSFSLLKTYTELLI